MTQLTREERFRRAAEAEGGMPVSAGLRIGHVRAGAEEGRIIYVDLSSVPELERPRVIARIRELVNEAAGRSAVEQPGAIGASIDAKQ